MSQSERMEEELEALRDLFKDARLNEDAARMLAISRVIIQHEKEISKQKIHEGKTLDRKKISQMADELATVCIRIGKETLPKDLYDKFIDRLLAELADIWEPS